MPYQGNEWQESGWQDASAASLQSALTADAWATTPTIALLSGSPQTTTKIPPAYDGRRLWFTYEEEVDEWCDITELSEDRRGPALRNRLEGDAAVYKSMLDRDQLKHPDTGVEYYKKTLRPHFVKGTTSVFCGALYNSRVFIEDPTTC